MLNRVKIEYDIDSEYNKKNYWYVSKLFIYKYNILKFLFTISWGFNFPV